MPECRVRPYACAIVIGFLVASCTTYRVADRDGGDASPTLEAGADALGSGGAAGLGGSGAGGLGAGGSPGTGGMTGTGGATGPGGSGAGGQIINTQTDGKNCGIVGHDCLGGMCTAGQCQPVLIAQYLGEPLSMAIGPTEVCETNIDGQIGCARKDGSDLRDFTYPSETAMAFLGARASVDGSRLVFSQLIPGGSFQIAACDIGNCEASSQALGGAYTQYSAVDPVSHRAYWIDGASIIYSATSGPPQVVQLPFDAHGASLGPPMLYSKNSILFTFQATAGPIVYRIPINSSGASTTAVAIGSGQARATNDQFVLWSESDGIHSIPLPNGLGGGSNLVLPGVTPENLTADQTSLYWTESPGVATCSIASCVATRKKLPPGPSTAMDVPFSTIDVAADDTAIFWVVETRAMAAQATLNSTKIFKLAK
jgi:hypothetical protein